MTSGGYSISFRDVERRVIWFDYVEVPGQTSYLSWWQLAREMMEPKRVHLKGFEYVFPVSVLLRLPGFLQLLTC